MASPLPVAFTARCRNCDYRCRITPPGPPPQLALPAAGPRTEADEPRPPPSCEAAPRALPPALPLVAAGTEDVDQLVDDTLPSEVVCAT
jgi:hypothetical protein